MASVIRKALATVFWLPATASLALLHFYRLVLSPDHGLMRHMFPYGYCRHEPTCSTYAEAQLRVSLWPVAVMRILLRVLSCHPWRKPDDARLRSAVKKVLD
jgi:putative component of membrane protein insertase Oxa1/YidC/SpoIIIJ protein YidD